MAQAKQGDTVKVHYKGTLTDGSIFDSSEGREPLQFTVGQRQLIPDFEQAVIGMSCGDTKTIQIAAESAYGPHRSEMVMVVDKSEFPEGLDPQLDQMLQVQQPNGQPFAVKVTEINGDKVTLDANHPLAGKDLTFDIELAEIC